MGLSKGILKFLNVDSLMEGLSGYIEARLDLFKIEAREELSEFLSKAIVWGVLFLLLCFTLLFLSITLSLFLGNMIHNYTLGFLITGGFYLLIFGVVLIFKDRLQLKSRIYRYLETKIKVRGKDGGKQ